MAKLALDNFVDLVRKSELIEAQELDRALDEVREKHGGQLPEDSEVLAEEFISRDLLTNWHCEKLLQGKYKGFMLGKYKLLRLLGTGGMSAVYLAEHIKMRRRVAIKVLPKTRVGDSSYLDRFYREGEAAAKLNHANIVKAFDIDCEKDTHYLVMEFVEGLDLQHLVKQKGPLDFKQAADYIAQAADGLEHAHENNLIHRDIKPANLLVDEKGVVKILDMGLARFDDDKKASLTIAYDENVLGTADYLAPEQALNSHSVDSRADLYSLGCTLYYVLTGHPPFPEGTLAQRIHKHQTEMPADLTTERPGCPPELADICNKMMRKKARRRFQSATEVAEALRAWLSGESGSAVRNRNGVSGSGSEIVRRRKANQALADTMSDESGDTRKGLDEGSDKSRKLRVAKPLEPDASWRTDSGAIDLDIDLEGLGSTPSTSPAGQSPVLMSTRRHKRKAAPWWIWMVLAAGLIVAVIMMYLVAHSIAVNNRRPAPTSAAPLEPGLDRSLEAVASLHAAHCPRTA